MPLFRVLKDKRFAEWPVAGAIADIDENAAAVALAEGAIERLNYEEVSRLGFTAPVATLDEKKDQASSDLKTVSGVLDTLGVKHWLTLGTALGAYRDKDFCINDWNDIDLGLFKEDYARYQDIDDALVAEGFTLGRTFIPEDGISPELAYVKEHDGYKTKVDLFFYTEDPDDDTSLLWRFYKNQEATEYVTKSIPKSLLSRFKDIKFRGDTYKIPAAIVKFLTHNYGDWKTPKPRPDWDYLNDSSAPTKDSNI
jgi:hypothetical protein